MKKAALVVALVTSFIAVFPLSIRLADPFFTFPFHKDWYHCVLLVWPGHVEARSFDDLAEVSPRPKDVSYTFNVSPDPGSCEKWRRERRWTPRTRELDRSALNRTPDFVNNPAVLCFATSP